MEKFRDNAKLWHYYPYLAFPKQDTDIRGNRLEYPSNWYIYQVHTGSYLLDNRSNQIRHNKLANESIILKKWEGIPKYTKL